MLKVTGKVTVPDSPVKTVDRQGKPPLRFQEVDVLLESERFPRTTEIFVPRTGPYAPGEYEGVSIYFDRNNRLQLGFDHLSKVADLKVAK